MKSKKTAQKRGRGRPRKPAEETRIPWPLKLTEAERELIQRAGAPRPTVWAREVVLAAARASGGR